MALIDNPFRPEWDDLFYGPDPRPDSRRLREFSRWLFHNKLTEIRLFHGTAANLPIMEKGLLPTSAKRRRSYQSASGFVYLSVFPGMAHDFGRMGAPTREIVVYAVQVLIKNLRPDKDQLANRRRESGLDFLQDTLSHSLVYGRGARVRGRLEPWRLKPLRRVDTCYELAG